MHTVGEQFNLDTFLSARKQTHDALRLCASKIEVGMNEEEGQKVIESTLQSLGITERWHPPKLRIGKDTVKSFSEKPDQSLRLQEEDIFFLDLGLIYQKHEGDFGETFTIGDNSKLKTLANASKDIFHSVQHMWRQTALSGTSLYEMAHAEARKFGLELIPTMDGHRLGDFPHGKQHKGSLLDCHETPKQHLWVMEILVRDPSLGLGSFYEDILI